MRPSSRWRADLGYAAFTALAVLCIHAVSGFASLSDAGGDNDSLLRMVEVRDLLAGQGWFDLHQYRMGLEGGFVMHWSRFVDLPIAALVVAGAALTGSAAGGEAAAMILWPTVLLMAALFFLVRAARSFGGETLLPALVIGAVGLHFLNIFGPGALDHHNVQVVLTLAMVSLLLDATAHLRNGLLAGGCAALMLTVGMEAAPYVAIAGTCVAAWFLLEGDGAHGVTAGFGFGFGTVALASFLLTVPASGWFVATCDAYSIVQMAVSAAAGFGLALVASSPALSATIPRRLSALAVLGGAVGALLVAAFPQCLGDPFAGMDPRLRTYWLDAIAEAQPFWKIVATRPALAATYYATPLLALVCLAFRLRRGALSRTDLLVAGFLAVAFAVSLWQVRGAMFSIPLSVIPLAAWVAGWRARAQGSAVLATTLKMVLAWLLSLTVTWTAAAAGLSDLLAPSPRGEGAVAPAGSCEARADFGFLASLPPARVLAISNLGSPILLYTHHRVLSGPYHRNVAGNLAALSAFMESEAAARAIVRRNGISLVAICTGNGETGALADWAPEGFIAAMRAGRVPPWLSLLPETAGQPLRLYRVSDSGGTAAALRLATQ